jgi:16S rRNA (uracil1498-N3)-methyltransferase
MQRFFVPSTAVKGEEVHFLPEQARQMSRVLRLRPGAEVLALDGSGQEWRVRLDVVTDGVAWGRALEQHHVEAEPQRVRLTLYLGLTQREKFEWMLQKCTEAGAAGFVPVICERSLVQQVAEVEAKRQRWERIIREAAEQSGRGCVPALHPAQRLAAALPHSQQQQDLTLLAWEEERKQGLGGLLRAQTPKHVLPLRLAIWVGPEGGFAADEVQLARQAGALPISLGRRILRMETAALAVTLLALHYLEDQAA